jgi:hypothetical protein
MAIPWPDGPDSSVNGPDSNAQVAQGLQVVVRQLATLNQAITAQTAQITRTMNAQSRYQVGSHGGGVSNTPQMNPQIVANVQAAGQQLGSAGTGQTTGMGAMSSMAGMQSYLLQQLGQWIAGVPLYQPTVPGGSGPGTYAGGGSAGGGGRGGGGTPGGPIAGGGPGGGPSGGGGGGRRGGGGGGGSGSGGGGGGGPVMPTGGLAGAVMGGAISGAIPPSAAARSIQVLQNVGAQVASSGGTSITGMIGSALRAIPGVGLVADAANSATNAYLNQREAGRVYQNVEGGSNLDAQTERLHEAVYQASMYGRMPQGAAAQAFGTVTAMGYNQAAVGEGQQPQNRQSALNFIYGNYTKTGMDTSQSEQILQTASGNAQVNLTQLSAALNSLSEDAGKAGANADTARQQFNSYFASALGQGAGNGSTTLAAGISSMQASMGKEFSGVNFSGELSQQRQYLLSGMSGQTPAQLQYMQRNDPQQYLKMLSGQNMQFLTSGGLMTPQMTASMNSLINKAGGAAKVAGNPGVRDQIATQFLNQNQVSGNINENLWAQEISALTGVNMNSSQAFQWIVSQSAGDNESSHNSSLPNTGTTSLAPTTSTSSAAVSAAAAKVAATKKATPTSGNALVSKLDGIFGLPAPKTINTGSAAAGETAAKAKVAAAAKAAPAKTTAATAGASTTAARVTVDLTPNAAQLLKMLPTNNDEAAATSSVPANPYVSQSSR